MPEGNGMWIEIIGQQDESEDQDGISKRKPGSGP
jgi:hypothetical protein